MPKPFDATLKELITGHPVDWLTQAVARAIFNKVIAMQESGTYQLILEEGAVKHMREWILKQARDKLGEPNEKQKNKLSAIEDLGRLDRIALKVLTAKNWDSLLRVQ